MKAAPSVAERKHLSRCGGMHTARNNDTNPVIVKKSKRLLQHKKKDSEILLVVAPAERERDPARGSLLCCVLSALYLTLSHSRAPLTLPVQLPPMSERPPDARTPIQTLYQITSQLVMITPDMNKSAASGNILQ